MGVNAPLAGAARSASVLPSALAGRWYDGPEDPDLQLIEVRIQSAEYWDSPDSGIVRMVGVLRAAVTGEEHEVGTHGEVKGSAPSH